MLLEREVATAALTDALARVTSTGDGEIVVVGGEAGVGKTSVVRAFSAALGEVGGVERWWGACDNMHTPRPLGPLVDVADLAGDELALAFRDGKPRVQVFDAGLAALRRTGGVAFVIEDAHWADDATLDFVRFVGRRLDGVPALIVLTFRDDETGPLHPLRIALGDLGGARVTRVRLSPLSAAAVAIMADGSELDPIELHATTGGNPFFVTETLAAGGLELAASVRDAVLARAALLSTRGRAALEGAAISPGRVELWMLDEIVGDDATGVDECVDRGLLVPVDGGLIFRHELARLVVEESVPPARRRDMHRRALEALTGRAEAARLAYHAAEADNFEALVEHARQAAADASAVGALRAAVDHLRQVARHLDLLDDAEAATAMDDLANVSHAVGSYEESIEAHAEAARRWHDLGDTRHEAASIARASGPLVMLGRNAEADAADATALSLLSPLPPSPELVLVLVGATSMRMLARELDAAVESGHRAIDLARQLGCDDQAATGLIQTGCAEMMRGDPDEGIARIREGIALSQKLEWDTGTGLGLAQIGSGCGEIRRYDLAVPALEECLTWCEPRDQLSHMLYATAWLARCEVELGRWELAGARATDLLESPSSTGIFRFTALNALGMLRARRGDPGVWVVLDEALAIARETGHLQRLWPIAATRAEAAWLEDRAGAEDELVAEVLALASSLDYPWAVEELEWWSGRGAGVRTPFGLQSAGRFSEAAAAWDAIGAPYQAAAARAHGDVSEQQAAFAVLFDHGAAPLARKVAARLLAAGERVPRRPTATTRANPHGLTTREMDVLALLVDGHTNGEIAARLFISSKTVDHHVSSILSKLGVATRRDAARAARDLLLTQPP